jgi:aspartyl-tRNA(Asn)/glutamyl-tRNA(Gln) amidotransferase subunit A
MSEDVVFLSGRELRALLLRREISPLEIVDAYLARIEALDPKLNSFITVTADEARSRAREVEREIHAGTDLGPLHGIPYAPKDILATRGIRTTNGSKLTAGWIPDFESTITERLNRAGAILLGKLNLLEFAMGSGVLSGFGPARNPWHLDYSPSGSSSGSGAALAAYLTPLSIGTDTGGSIRGPAAACGIVGLKQTYGRVSRFGVTTLSWTLDHAGPMTKTVADAADMLQAIAGPDPKDPTAVADPAPARYAEALTGDVRGMRIGIPRTYFFDGAHEEVSATVRRAVDLLASMGARLVDVDVPHAKYAGSAGWIVAMAEASAFHEKRLRESPELFDPLVRERLETAKFYSAIDYVKSLRVRSILQAEMAEVFESCDVMAVPGSTGLPSMLDSEETAGSDVKPGSTSPAFRPGNTFLGNMTGNPAVTIPCGFSEGPPELPITIQLYGRPFDEAAILRVAHAYESATDWHRRRPPLG